MFSCTIFPWSIFIYYVPQQIQGLQATQCPFNPLSKQLANFSLVGFSRRLRLKGTVFPKLKKYHVKPWLVSLKYLSLKMKKEVISLSFPSFGKEGHSENPQCSQQKSSAFIFNCWLLVMLIAGEDFHRYGSGFQYHFWNVYIYIMTCMSLWSMVFTVMVLHPKDFISTCLWSICIQSCIHHL